VTVTLDGWLNAITIASKQADSFAKSKDDPFPLADSIGFIGRVSRWMISGMQQTSAQPFLTQGSQDASAASSASLRWMTRQTLSGNPIYENTLLRGEAVRLDWSSGP
jgi:hypothetical protein